MADLFHIPKRIRRASRRRQRSYAKRVITPRVHAYLLERLKEFKGKPLNSVTHPEVLKGIEASFLEINREAVMAKLRASGVYAAVQPDPHNPAGIIAMRHEHLEEIDITAIGEPFDFQCRIELEGANHG